MVSGIKEKTKTLRHKHNVKVTSSGTINLLSNYFFLFNAKESVARAKAPIAVLLLLGVSYVKGTADVQFR